MMLKKAMVLKKEMWEKEKAEEEARWAEELSRAKGNFAEEQKRKIHEDFKRRAMELLKVTQERKRKREEEGKTGAE